MKRRIFIKSVVTTSILYSIGKTSFSNAALKNDSKPNDATSLNISSFGAKSHDESSSESPFDNAGVIQKVIDICSSKNSDRNGQHAVYIPEGVFYVSVKNFGDNSSGNVGAYSILLKNNVIVTGPGTIKVFPNAYGKGAFYRTFASDSSERLKNVLLSNITIDGNLTNQVPNVQASNIVIEASGNIYINSIRSVNANGSGILVRGKPHYPATDIEISDCFVSNCKKIGIQVSQFTGIKIEGNHVSNCNDNGIDIYGDNGPGDTSTNGNNFLIKGNIVSNCLNGIFPETVSHGVVTGNRILNSKLAGVHVNRIHGKPTSINISGNIISGAKYGAYFTGDMSGVSLLNNKMNNVSSSFVAFGSGQGNTSNISIDNNEFHITEGIGSLYYFSGKYVRDIDIKNNKIIGSTILKQEIINSTSEKSLNHSVVFD